jgi:hypothetical protein
VRGVALLAIASAGCGFHVAASGQEGPGDDARMVDAPADETVPVDMFVVQPACMMNPAYSNGPNNGSRYRKTGGTDYDGAIDACGADGAHLAVLDTMAENMFATQFGAGDQMWIGYDDLTTEGLFKWVAKSNGVFSGYSGTEPNDNNGEDCTYLRSDGGWNDTGCDDTFIGLCECETGYVAPPRPACRTMSGATIHEGRRYFIRDTTPLSWAAAKADCESIGAHLAVVSDLREHNDVDNDFFGDSWIGLTDLAVEGTFVWVNGSTDAYRKFDGSSPHAGNVNRNCVRINFDWQDVDCTTLKEYACECDPLPP